MAKSPKQVAHKQADCIGCAFCVETAPDYFAMGADGLAFLLAPNGRAGPLTFAKLAAQDRPVVEAAAEGCPVDIISLQ